MGNMNFDEMCHHIFDKSQQPAFVSRNARVHCCFCGHPLETYYCEDRLYLVRCKICETATLVKAISPKEAACNARAFPILPTDEIIDEDRCAAFFDHIPIDEPPIYVGTCQDFDLPKNAHFALPLPYPATDENEYKEA